MTQGETRNGTPLELAQEFLQVVEEMALADTAMAAKEGGDMADQQFFAEGDIADTGHGIFCIGINHTLVNLESKRFIVPVLGTMALMGATRFAMSLHSYITLTPDVRPSAAPDRRHGNIVVAFIDGRWYQKTFVVPNDGQPVMEVLSDWELVNLQDVGRPYEFMRNMEWVIADSTALKDPVKARVGLDQLRGEFHAGLYGPLKPREVPRTLN